MTSRENYLKAVHFDTPDYIPMTFAINSACWHHYDNEQLFDLIAEHKLLFPDFVRPEKGSFKPFIHPVARKDEPYTDSFGCAWTTTDDGITGTVTSHPLSSWDNLAGYQLPDPRITNGLEPISWDGIKAEVSALKSAGELTFGGLRHGHTFLQLCDIRGYENLLFDMLDENENLPKLINKLTEFNLYIIEQYVKMEVDQISYAEDLGMQIGPMIPLELFKKYIKPAYRQLMKPALDKDMLIHMHSDGDIRSLADDLVDSGVQIINLQDLVNGVDWIGERYRGKVCVDLDIDRQRITPFGTPKEIDELIRYEVETLSLKQGGLTMIFGLYPNTPIENVKAVMDAMERYSGFHR